MPSESDITQLLEDAGRGNQRAADELLESVYEEIREMAANALRRERSGHTLQATALVHEAYLKLVDQTRVDWKGATHFKAVAAKAMSRVLIDHARRKNREKRGGNWRKVTLHDAFALAKTNDLDMICLHEALEKMRKLDKRQHQVVELRLFGGLTGDEAAKILHVSSRTVDRDWKMGQVWLRRELNEGASADE